MRNRILIYYVSTYVLIFFLPILVFVFFSWQTLAEEKTKSIDAERERLFRFTNNLERRFEEIETLNMNLSMDSRIQNLYKDNTNFYSLMEVQKSIPSYAFTDTLFSNVYIFIKNQEFIINLNSVIRNIEVFYDLYFRKKGIAFKDWKEGIWDNLYYNDLLAEPIVNISGTRILTYMHSLIRTTTPLGNYGLIMVTINENEIDSLLDKTLYEDGDIFILNKNDEIIYKHQNSTFEMNEFLITRLKNSSTVTTGNYLLTMAESNIGYTYITAMTLKNVFNSYNDKLKILLLLVLSACLLGILYAVYFGKKISDPVKRLVSLLSPNKNELGDNKPIFEFLDLKVSDLVNDVDRFKSELETRKTELRTSFIENLLKGNIHHDEILNQAFESYNINLDGNFYCAVIFRVKGYGNEVTSEIELHLSAAKIIVENIIKRFIKNNIFISLMNDVTAIIALKAAEDLVELKNRCQEIILTLRVENNILVQAAIGKLCSKQADIYRSYSMAAGLLDWADNDNTDIISENWHQHLTDTFYYPPEIEQRLIRAVLSGNIKNTESVLDYLYEENQKINMPRIIYGMFINDLCSTFIKLLPNVNTDINLAGNFIPEYINNTSGNEAVNFEKIKEAYLNLCILINQEKFNKFAVLKNEIILFVDKNYTDWNMSLVTVGDHFNLSELYISRFFQYEIGEKFSKYLEKLRMEKAQYLILNSNKSINEISAEVGYTTPHGFRSAYKRYYGSLPSRDRK